ENNKELTERHNEEATINGAFLGVTGSGKTFSVSNVMRNIGKPVLVMSHNKTCLATPLREFTRELKGREGEGFPENRVEFFHFILRLLSAGSLSSFF
ncbi:MAG: hypothetical protein IPH77_14325, partial [Ignavibacteria bacterium]|nr:hypothetical protein [Ignavibacteria bacterium]